MLPERCRYLSGWAKTGTVMGVLAVLLTGGGDVRAGVIAWEPGVGFFRTTLGNSSYPICNSNETTNVYSAASFDAVVWDSGALASVGCPGIPPPWPQGGSTGAGWSLRLSAEGVQADFDVNSSYVPNSSGTAGDARAQLRSYRFTLDAPTFVTLRVASSGYWQVDPTLENYRAVFNIVEARLVACDGDINLFPDFNPPPSGVLERTQLLSAGCYDFQTVLYLGGWDYSPAGSAWHETSQVTLWFGDLAAAEPALPDPGAARVSMTPNPSRGRGAITLFVPESSDVDVALYDVAGRRVESIRNAPVSRGPLSFEWNPEHHLSGLYFIRIQGKNFSAASRAVFLK